MRNSTVPVVILPGPPSKSTTVFIQFTMKKITVLLGLLMTFSTMFAQTFTITGRVVDENQSPLPGVSVFVEGTTNGTITDLDGNFTLSIDRATVKYVTFSFVGYYKVRQPISEGVTDYQIMLTPEITNLDEIVVIGYGTQRKSDVTVSISSVKAKDIASPSVLSLDQSLQGQAAGVVVSQSTGKPGAPVSIRIRGTTSINGLNEPLYVIDGVPIITNASDLSS